MNSSSALPGKIIELQRSDRTLASHDTKTLVQTTDFRVVQIRLPAGTKIPTYEAIGEIIIHCLEGCISVVAQGIGHKLTSDQLLYLVAAEPFSILAEEDSSVIATIVSPTRGRKINVIGS